MEISMGHQDSAPVPALSGAAETVIPIHPIPAAPVYLDEQALNGLRDYSNNSELLTVTPDNVVYSCSSGAMQALRRGLSSSANPESSGLVENAVNRLRAVAIEKGDNVWIPRTAIALADANIYKHHRRHFLFTRKDLFFYFSIALGSGLKLHFLQQPVRNQELARSMFRKTTTALLGSEGRWRLAELGLG